ncbi:MAG: 3-oxoacyl-ACP reductase FabG [Oleiphilaceae bacterium]|nr:3-oxoacyl-ACP reductase FabG [Oleiphilaceae bacterium]
MSVERKVALVTGASRGIGRAIAKRLALNEGVTVIGTATTEDGASSISHYFSKWGLSGDGIKMDVSDPDSVLEGVQQVTQAYGPPLILVNNAGITRDGLMLRMNEEDWESVINTNLSSVYRVTKAVLRGMTKARWGRVINISSVVGQMGNAGQANYCASKAGIEGFTRSLAKEISGRGITINAVAPGFIETDMTEELPDATKASMLATIPMARLGQPDEIAAAVNFLSSDDASYITGEILHVNGGMFMG